MEAVERMVFAVGVFKDVAWAERGIAALKQQGFDPAGLSFLATETPEAIALIERTTGAGADRIALPVVGAAVGRGALLETLQGGARDLGRIGVAAAMRRAGFQAHDGLIYETLTSRGGILVAVQGAPVVADALATLLSYGAGNAAIGAWDGRV